MSPAPATAPLPSHREWRYVSSIRCGSLDLKNLTRRLRCLIRFMCTLWRGSGRAGRGNKSRQVHLLIPFIYFSNSHPNRARLVSVSFVCRYISIIALQRVGRDPSVRVTNFNVTLEKPSLLLPYFLLFFVVVGANDLIVTFKEKLCKLCRI